MWATTASFYCIVVRDGVCYALTATLGHEHTWRRRHRIAQNVCSTGHRLL